MNQTKVTVGGKDLTVQEELVSISRFGSPLPTSIVGAKGSKAKVVSDNVSFVSDDFFEMSDLGDLSNERPGEDPPPEGTPVTISNAGNLLFRGRLNYERSQIKTGGEAGRDGDEHFFEMIGGGAELWTDLEGLNLNELDLGTVIWNRAEVERNWAETVDDGHKGSFAPAVYGASDNPLAFTTSDLRYHVYFLTIINAIIEGHAKYTLQSSFFQTDLFKRCAHTFGTGDAIISEDNNVVAAPSTTYAQTLQPFTASDNQVLPFATAQNGPDGTFNVAAGTFSPTLSGPHTVGIEIDYTANISFIEVLVNGQPVASRNPTSPSNFDTSVVLSLNSGDAVSVRVQLTNSQTTQIIFYRMEIQGTTTAAPFDQTPEVASCLPAEGAKDFIRGISHLFNLEWFVDAQRRIVYAEPRFPYTIDGVTRPGFYDLIDLRPEIGERLDRSVLATAIQGYRGQLEFGYNSSTSGLARYFSENVIDREGVAFSAIRFQNADTRIGSRSKSQNPYFQALATSGPQYVGSPSLLPHLWTRGEVVASGLSEFPNFDYSEPTFQHPPSCGIVRSAGADIFWEGGTVPQSVPLLSQGVTNSTNDNVPGMALTYGDLPGPNLDSYPGIGTVFYQHLASTLFRGRLVTTQNAIPNALDVYTEDFRKATALRYTGGSAYPSILLSIEKYRPGGTAQLKYLTFVPSSLQDVALVRHYNHDHIPLGEQTCDYLFEDVIAHTDNVANKPLVRISLLRGIDLPLSYPYNSSDPTEPARLQNDIETLLNLLGIDFGGVICSAPTGGVYVRWRIEITATRLALNVGYVVSSGMNAGRGFTPSNCS